MTGFAILTLMGTLVADPEVKQTPTGKSVVNFSVVVNFKTYNSTEHAYETEAVFIQCTAWEAQAKFISKFFKKGSPIALTGKLKSRTYKDEKQPFLDVTEAFFVPDGKKGNTKAESKGTESAVSDGTPGFDDIEAALNGEGLPF